MNNKLIYFSNGVCGVHCLLHTRRRGQPTSEPCGLRNQIEMYNLLGVITLARIADKHGFTNRYRKAGSFKRNVKRGRPRKYLFGAPSKKRSGNSKTMKDINYKYTSETTPMSPTKCGCLVSLVVVILLIGHLYSCFHW